MRLPLNITITTAFALFTTVSISLVAAVNYLGGRQTVLETAKADIAKSAREAEAEIDGLIGQAVVTADAVAGLSRHMFDWQAPEALFSILSVALRNSPHIYSVFVGFPDGAFVQAVSWTSADGRRRVVDGVPDEAVIGWRVMGPASETGSRPQIWRYFDAAGTEVLGLERDGPDLTSYDPRLRPWYMDAQLDRKPTLSDVYVFASLNRPGVTFSRPLHSMPGATVGIDLSLDDLSGLARRLRPGTNGVFAILDGRSNVIALSTPGGAIRKTAGGVGDELMSVDQLPDRRVGRAVAAAVKTGKSDVAFLVDGVDFIGHLRAAAHGGMAA